MSLSAVAYLEKNKLASPNVWFVLLKLTMVDGTIMRLVNNTEFVIWPDPDGDVWAAFPFELGDTLESTKNEVPRVSLRVSNSARILEPYLEEQDGLVNSDIDLYVVNSAHIYTPSKGHGVTNLNPEVELNYKVISTSVSRQWVNFSLGAGNPFNKRFPRNKVWKNLCRYRGALGTENGFKGARCQYSGSAVVCDRTLVTCRAYGNSINFGGFPGVGTKGTFV